MEDSLEKLIRDFKKARIQLDKKERTIFEISGYPHAENVVSNILGFFFDTKEEHNLSDIWLRSLLEAYNKNVKHIIEINGLYVEDIKREYSNGSQKRIDLLIDARPLIVVIENKVDAGIDNPFDIYKNMAANYVKSQNITNPQYVYIILSKVKEDNQEGFINVTYEELFKNVDLNKKGLKTHNKWTLFADEFETNLKKKGLDMKMKIDPKWNDFIKKYKKDLSLLIEKNKEDIQNRISFLESINESLGDIGTRKNVYYSNTSTYLSQFVDFDLKDKNTICIESFIYKPIVSKEDSDILTVSLWCRTNKKYDFSKLLGEIGDKDTHETNSPGWGKYYVLKTFNLNDCNVLDVSKLIQEYAHKISHLFK